MLWEKKGGVCVGDASNGKKNKITCSGGGGPISGGWWAGRKTQAGRGSCKVNDASDKKWKWYHPSYPETNFQEEKELEVTGSTPYHNGFKEICFIKENGGKGPDKHLS